MHKRTFSLDFNMNELYTENYKYCKWIENTNVGGKNEKG